MEGRLLQQAQTMQSRRGWRAKRVFGEGCGVFEFGDDKGVATT